MNVETFLKYKAATGKAKDLLLNKLVKENAPLAKKFADRALKRTSVHADVDDVLQAALIGLTKAIKGLDPTKGRLSTIAAWHIRYEIQKELEKHVDIHRPEDTGVPYRVMRAQERFYAENGREPNAAELNAMVRVFRKGKQLVLTDAMLDDWRTEHKRFTVSDNLGGSVEPLNRTSQIVLHSEETSPEALYEERTFAEDVLPRALNDLSWTHREVILALSENRPVRGVKKSELKKVTEEAEVAFRLALERYRG